MDLDLEHALMRKDHARMWRGEFQPGDIELVRKFLRLSEEQMAGAMGGIPASMLALADKGLDNGSFNPSPLRSLLLLAVREPRAFRRALVQS